MSDDLRRLRALIYGAAMTLPIAACTPSGADDSPASEQSTAEHTEVPVTAEPVEEWAPDEVDPGCEYEERCVPCPEDPSVQTPAAIPTGSALARREGDTCCYMIELGCMGGRALWVDDVPRVAPLVREDTWSHGTPAAGTAESGVAARWADQGLAEHASVASFARATLELMAHGAPPDLVRRTQAASIDEVYHAQACFALAASAGGVALGPGRLPAATPRALDATGLALAVFGEACVGETIASLIAMRQHAVSTHRLARETLARIIDDEARHAALGWDTLRWLIHRAPDAREALAQRATRLRRQLDLAIGGTPKDTSDPTYRTWGLLSRHEEALAALEAFDGLVAPLLATCLDALPLPLPQHALS